MERRRNHELRSRILRLRARSYRKGYIAAADAASRFDAVFPGQYRLGDWILHVGGLRKRLRRKPWREVQYQLKSVFRT